MEKSNATFGKAEHLCGVTAIDDLFENGRSSNFRLFRAVYLVSEPEPQVPSARILISIPKRLFKKAVVRNLLKRRIREAYRKNKTGLLCAMDQKNKRIDVAVVWTSKNIASYNEITECITEMINRLSSASHDKRS